MKRKYLIAIAVLSALTLSFGQSDGQQSASDPPRVARTSFEGLPALKLDFPSMEIGVAEYESGPTGTTVFYFPKGAMAAVNVQGGWPGTMNTDGLRLGYETTSLDAVVFSGGSYYGLASPTGVANEIRKLRDQNTPAGAVPGRDSAMRPAHVVGAIVFDLGRRFNTIAPDAELGAEAFRSRKTGWFPLGARGAGRMTGQGGGLGERAKGGQGGAFRQVGPTKIAVFVVLNGGAVVDRAGNVVSCTHPASEGLGRSAAEHFRRLLSSEGSNLALLDTDLEQGDGFSKATNLTLVVTNQKMSWADLQRLAIQVNTSMGRAIQPYNTRGDGDTLYAVSTQEIENPDINPGRLALYASETAWDAVLAGVPVSPPPPRTSSETPDPQALNAYVGEYEFGRGAVLSIRRSGNHLTAQATGERNVFGFALKQPPTDLQAASGDEFYQDNRWQDRLVFLKDRSGRINGLTWNPSLYDIQGHKIR